MRRHQGPCLFWHAAESQCGFTGHVCDRSSKVKTDRAAPLLFVSGHGQEAFTSLQRFMNGLR